MNARVHYRGRVRGVGFFCRRPAPALLVLIRHYREVARSKWRGLDTSRLLVLSVPSGAAIRTVS
jgi:hypothetical protein